MVLLTIFIVSLPLTSFVKSLYSQLTTFLRILISLPLSFYLIMVIQLIFVSSIFHIYQRFFVKVTRRTLSLYIKQQSVSAYVYWANSPIRLQRSSILTFLCPVISSVSKDSPKTGRAYISPF